MKRIAVILAALALIASPVVAQSPQQPPAGTVVVVAGVSDGVTWVPVPGSIVIPPVACNPS